MDNLLESTKATHDNDILQGFDITNVNERKRNWTVDEWMGWMWQSIETAPKDGTNILVYPYTYTGASIGVCTCINSTECENEEYEVIYGVTHWMPLPTPPGVQS